MHRVMSWGSGGIRAKLLCGSLGLSAASVSMRSNTLLTDAEVFQGSGDS